MDAIRLLVADSNNAGLRVENPAEYMDCLPTMAVDGIGNADPPTVHRSAQCL